MLHPFPSPINGSEVNAVNARDLHGFLEVGKDFSTWFKERVCQYGFEPRRDFEVFDSPVLGNQTGRGGDRRTKDYMISIDMAKELCMVERNEKGKEARQYFIECERQAKPILRAESSPMSRQLTRDEAQANMRLSGLFTEKEIQFLLNAPGLDALRYLMGDGPMSDMAEESQP